MGLQVPLLVQRQIWAQPVPYLPLGQTAKQQRQKCHDNSSDPHAITEMWPQVKSTNNLALNVTTSWAFLCKHMHCRKTYSSHRWCRIWVDMKWSVWTKGTVTAFCGTTAPFPLTRVEWLMCHIIKIDHVHRPLYAFLMKLIFQCPPAHFNKGCHLQWNLLCVFLFQVRRQITTRCI